MSELHLPRRRRSAAHAPLVVDPADVPDDASGRVEVIAIRAPADVIDPGEAQPAPPPDESHVPARLLAYDGWLAIGVLGAVLVVLFAIGMVLTH